MRAKFSGFSEIASSRTGQLRGRRGRGGPSVAGMSQCIIISIIIVIIIITIIFTAMIIISNISTLIIITNINIIINMIIIGWLPLTSLEGHH